MKSNNRTVYLSMDGKWADKKNADRYPTGYYISQIKAISSARGNLVRDGGGELVILGETGKIRIKEMIGLNDLDSQNEIKK
jgi:hypothetical protein